jgi:transcriptional regulator with XRE-family HTH domain
VADKVGVDTSTVGKWESGTRKPSRDQVDALARYLKADRKAWVVAWLRDQVVYDVLQNDEFALDALKAAEAQVKYQAKRPNR